MQTHVHFVVPLFLLAGHVNIIVITILFVHIVLTRTLTLFIWIQQITDVLVALYQLALVMLVIMLKWFVPSVMT